MFRMLRMVSPPKSELPAPEDVTLITPEQEWVRSAGWTPLEYLTNAYRNPFIKHGERIAAAKAVLDYMHKRMPLPTQMLGADPTNPLLPAGAAGNALGKLDVTKLTDEELGALMAIIGKASAA
jgi:hypothetical protein